jgi:hypothetical protein
MLYLLCFFRLTAAKEAGESIEIDGKKVALGIPQPSKAPEPDSLFATIPLGRGGTPDEAATAMLLCGIPLSIITLWLTSVLQLIKPLISPFFIYLWSYP